MRTVPLLPLSLRLPIRLPVFSLRQCHHHHHHHHHHPPLLSPSPTHLFSPLNSTKPVVSRVNVPRGSESDSNDVDDNMEGYLDHLSLEYDSVWDTKPSWCQPWTITLTGVSIIAISWLFLHAVLVTSFISFLIGAWWYIFLYSYPKAYSEMIAERRERVTDGVEDTFGRRKEQ